MNRMIFILMLSFFVSMNTFCLQAQVRQEIAIPDIPGYITLTYDPHMHSVFSDGLVWPTVRVHEAWREGLDIISITEHIEYRPFRSDVQAGHNRAYEITRPVAEQIGVMLIHGSEITRGMPPGHFNALFLSDAEPLDTSDWRDAMRAAREQGAFIMWNHPGWSRQQPDTTLWWDEHTWLYKNDLLHGIEIVNGWEYYPEAHQWCLDKGLTMIGASDIHQPINMYYGPEVGQLRPMTLVFATERTPESVREALFEGRTAVYFNNSIAGPEKHLKALFGQSLSVESVTRRTGSYSIALKNETSVPISLSKAPGNEPGMEFFRNIVVPAGGYSNFTVYMKDAGDRDFIELKLVVDNFLSNPGKGMPVSMMFQPD